jgi:mono/diheme cytochrome c family protein
MNDAAAHAVACGPPMRPLLFLFLTVTGVLPAAEAPDFTREIRPLLSENCFHCHGPDANHRKGDLRLDTREDALQSIVPGRPEESELYRRLVTHAAEDVMPPPKSNRSLTPAQIERIRLWIAGGAVWGEHWAFSPLVRPTPPGDAKAHPVDAFVHQELKRAGRQPTPPAAPAALLRRLSLDLTGLPPTPAEVEAFLADPSPDAYARQVDRLLASPAFGERMAWDWLDAARYADSNGYQHDDERTMWPWRDWVVQAFNRNQPYDQFLTWQLAGDLLPQATPEQRLATAFLRNHPINGEGGRIPEENRVDYGMDMAETVGTVWLGLTFNCCRCHDHKYDPLTQRDYYSFFAFFNRTPVDGSGKSGQTPPVLEAPSPEQSAALAAVRQRESAARTALAAREREWESGRAAWEARRLAEANPSPWRPLTPIAARAEGQTLTLQPGNRVRAGGDNPAQDVYEVTYTLAADTPLAALRLHAMRHPDFTHGGLARSDSGNFVLTDIAFTVRAADGSETSLPIATAEATFEQGPYKVALAFDRDPASGWAVWDGKPIARDHAAVFRLAQPWAGATGATLHARLAFQSPHRHHQFGLFRLEAAADPGAPLTEKAPGLLAHLRTPEAERDKQARQQVREAHQAEDPELPRLREALAEAAKALKQAQAGVPQVMVMEDQANPRKTFRLDRGLYTQPREEVFADTPGFLPPLATGGPANRLALARWLTAPEQPLTARVVVNRLWQQIFGVGLVKTAEDFGVQAEVPRHLDLLNWLAADFRDSGWDTRALLRRILTSDTYRQSSADTPERIAADPENRLLSRGPRFRQPAWMLRDQALAASGLLVARAGGPGVNPYQPDGLWEEASFGTKKYRRDHGDALHRRSLYTFWRRILAPPLFFDNAGRMVCTVKSTRTNTPLQALTTLNDTTYVEAARALAQHVLRAAHPDPAARLDEAFRRVLARPADPPERERLLAALDRHRARFTPDSAQRFLAHGESPRDPALDPIEHAAWTAIALTLLNLDEALSKE